MEQQLVQMIETKVDSAVAQNLDDDYAPELEVAMPELATFPLEIGYRDVFDPLARAFRTTPLTLLDILYPQEDDIGVVTMAQSPWHDVLTVMLAAMMRVYLVTSEWLVLQDVLVHWGWKGVPNKSPDIALVPGGKQPPGDEKSYRVGRDGTVPSFVIEVTSSETRMADLYEKVVFYAAVGVKEYLIIDLLPEKSDGWELLGYRFEGKPYFSRMQPDVDGGLTFSNVGLRFLVNEANQLEVIDSKTGTRWLRPEELHQKSLSDAKRAEEEAKRADVAEARVIELERKLKEMEPTTTNQQK